MTWGVLANQSDSLEETDAETEAAEGEEEKALDSSRCPVLMAVDGD